MDKDGNLATTVEKHMATSKVYIELFRECRGNLREMNCVTGPTILESDVKKALEQFKNGKATSLHEIAVESMNLLGEVSTKNVIKLFNAIYNSSHIPED